MKLNDIYQMLNSVLEDKVFYGTNVYDNLDNTTLPYIVYQVISKRPYVFLDDKPYLYKLRIQITLVEKIKDVLLEEKLEQTLLDSGFAFSLISEQKNQDKSLSKIYEIIMEEI